jgi:hypothetical protein
MVGDRYTTDSHGIRAKIKETEFGPHEPRCDAHNQMTARRQMRGNHGQLKNLDQSHDGHCEHRIPPRRREREQSQDYVDHRRVQNITQILVGEN